MLKKAILASLSENTKLKGHLNILFHSQILNLKTQKKNMLLDKNIIIKWDIPLQFFSG